MFDSPVLSNRAIYVRLLTYLRPYWKAFALAVLGMVAIAATEPVFPAIMKYLLDQGFKTEDARMVWLIPLGIILLFVVRGIFTFCTSYLMTWISTRLITDLRREMFAKILVLPTQVYHEQSAGKLISRLIYDVSLITEAATTVLVTIVRESLTAIALIAYLLYLDWKLTLITLAIGPLFAVIVKAFSQRMRAASRLISGIHPARVARHRGIRHCAQGHQDLRRTAATKRALPARHRAPATRHDARGGTGLSHHPHHAHGGLGGRCHHHLPGLEPDHRPGRLICRAVSSLSSRPC